jgi:hypothetical protein
VPLSLVPQVTVPPTAALDAALVAPSGVPPPPQAASTPGIVAATLRPSAALIKLRRPKGVAATEGGTRRARYSASDSGRIIASCRQ